MSLLRLYFWARFDRSLYSQTRRVASSRMDLVFQLHFAWSHILQVGRFHDSPILWGVNPMLNSLPFGWSVWRCLHQILGKVVPEAGLEPATFRLWVERSYQAELPRHAQPRSKFTIFKTNIFYSSFEVTGVHELRLRHVLAKFCFLRPSEKPCAY